MSSVSIGGVLQHTRISSTLHELKITNQRERLSPRTWPFKQSLLTSGPREITFVGKSQRKTSSLWINDNYRESSPRPAPSCRGANRSWHERMSP
ncbi:hypothetical protein CRG98_032831 [Punica granatum]|uniref:Uncharacterized protein n=1 Tax=Punica granatum TaxID=22663 RepID=A0A2I0IS08_PUNGR|nr:hypothetical protein CRG98_032831 [Punica granatum]